MIKKISAVVLALILCFSVVVLPASAAGFDASYALGADQKVAIKVELDKATYEPGETATVSVYVRADDASVFGAGGLVFGLNSAVFTQEDNKAATIKASSTANETYTSFYKTANTSTWTAPLSGTNLTKVVNGNTADENAAYDWFVKVVIARNMNGTHANAGALNDGLSGSEINADAAPYLQFQLKVSESATPGTPISIAIPSGSVSSAQSYWKIFDDPGNTTKATNTNLTTTDMTYTVATASVASEAPAGPALTHVRRELKMDVQDGAVVKGTEQLRVTSAISQADWDAYFANTTTEGATANAIQQVGIVAFKGQAADFNADTAKAVAQGTPADGYSAADTDYIQNDTASGTYKFGARIEYQSAAFDTTYIAYVKYLDAAGQVAYAFYDTTTTYSLNFATDYTNLTNGYINWLATQA